MSRTEPSPEIQVGDCVAFRRDILRNLGWYTRDLLHVRGRVTGLQHCPSTVLLCVAWDRPGLPTLFSPQELCRLPAEPKAAT